MEHCNLSHHPSLEEVQKQFDAWRQSRKHRTPIPKQLWKAAISLARHHSINTISRTLRLNHTELQKRVSLEAFANKAPDPPSPYINFVEYAMPLANKTECFVEMENHNGDKMRIFLSGERTLDLLSLGRSFWSRVP
jgi:hypothetical protein